LISLNKKSDR